MPVGQGVADAHEEQHSPPPALPIQSIQEAVPDERDLEEDSHDLGRAAAEAIAPEQSQGGLRAQVQFDYEKAEDNEIELREGEFVSEIEMVDEDWWVGVNAQGERGLFPGNYVEIVEDDKHEIHTQAAHEYDPEPEPAAAISAPPTSAAAPAPAAAASSMGPTATALFDYEAAEDNEIGFPEGAKITKVVS
jgi:hypothetical protein